MVFDWRISLLGFAKYILYLCIGFSPFVLLGVYAHYADKREYKRNFEKAQSLFPENKEEAIRIFLSMAKKIIIDGRFDKLEKDIMPFIREYCQSEKPELMEPIEKQFYEVTHYSTFGGGSMSSPSDYLVLHDKADKLQKLFDKMIEK